MTFSTTKLALGAVLTIAAAAAQAQGYVSLSAGASKADFDCTGSLSCDNKGTGFKLLGGYKFNPNVAIEGGYLDFGKATSQFTGAALGLGGGVYDVSIKTNGPAVGVAFHAPLAPSWNVVGRLGLLRAKTKATVSGPLGAADDSESSSQLYGGLAVGYAVTQQVSIEAGWDFSKAKYGGESATLNMFSLGLSVGF